MGIAEYLRPECIKVRLAAQSKVAAIRELVDLLVEKVELRAPEKVFEKLLERERLREGTFQGRFAAFPHCLHPDEHKDTYVAIGKPLEPIDWESSDDEPALVEFIVVVISTAKRNDIYAPLVRFSEILKLDSTCDGIRKSTTAAELYEFILREDKADEQAKALPKRGVSLRHELT